MPTDRAAPPQPLTDQPTRRWWSYVHRKQLVCAAGHHFKNNWSPMESGLIQCSKWIELEKRECGLWIFVFVVRGGKAIIAEVSQAESATLDELATPAQVIDYLGIFDQSGNPAAAPRAPSGPQGHHHHRR